MGQVSVPRRAATGGLLELFMLVSLVLFVASGALGIGVYLYNQYLETSSASKLDNLERASAAFEPNLIQELTRLDDRMRAASDILDRHLAPSAFFRMLEQTTLQTVSFRTLSFDVTDLQNATIKMEGIAESVNSIAHQADLFSKINMVGSPIFSDIDRRADGVHFVLSASLHTAALNYAALVRGFTPTIPQEVSVPAPASPFVETQEVSVPAPVSPVVETPSDEEPFFEEEFVETPSDEEPFFEDEMEL